MAITLKLGDKGENVKILQKALGVTVDGDFGPKTEAAVKSFQKSKGLIADGIAGPKTFAALGITMGDDLNIIHKPLPRHLTVSKGRPIKYLLIHYTAGSSSVKGKALSAYNTFMNRDASCDFAVDDEDIVCFNNDIPNKFSWQCGDGKGKYGITNTNSIGIEICSSLRKGYSAAHGNHEGWYFTEAALNNAVKLTKYLMKKYNIPFERVVRHYDASRKYCPGLVGWNDGSICDHKTGKPITNNNSAEWLNFKNRLK